MIDVLTLNRGMCPYFVVNNAVETVGLQRSIVPCVLGGAGNKVNFTAGDNFTVLSLGYKLPLGFELIGKDVFPVSNSDLLGVKLSVKIGLGLFLPIYPNVISVPFDNYELSLNRFVNTPSDLHTSAPFQLIWDYAGGTVGDTEPLVSMLNVPSSLNGKTFYLTPFVKIEHTFELQPEVPT